jgi:linoleoyl-CoA desaturase
MWNIYGKKYDLENFINYHPGGREILELTKNETDITSLFESYHAFSNKEEIKKLLEKYYVCDNNNNDIKQYDYSSYDNLINKVKVKYPTRNTIKTSYKWYIFNIINFISFINFFYFAMTSTPLIFPTTPIKSIEKKYYDIINYNIIYRCLFSVIAGINCLSLLFNILHDGSHYAISKYPIINIRLSNIFNSISLWNHKIWFYHHVYNHHSFTGENDDLKKDTDINHYHFLDKLNYKLKIFLLFFTVYIFPGIYIGQCLSYLIGSFTNKLWIIKIPVMKYYNFTSIICLIIKLYFLYQGLFLPTIIYIITLNIFYHFNTAINHDTYETTIENKYNGTDWLKLQICNSSNFSNKNIVWTYLFGGINYQIEHHLFPNMSYVHYSSIAPIVKEYCLENNIRYVHHDNIFDAYKSFIKMLCYKKY